MAKLKKELATLNLLLVSCKEAKNTYLQVADEERNLELIRFFNTQTTLRNHFVNELTAIIRNLGGKPRTQTIKSSMQRNIDGVVSSIIQFDSKKLLSRCMKKDEACIKTYNELIKTSQLPNEVIGVLFSQRNKLFNAIEVCNDFIDAKKTESQMTVVSV